MEKTCLPYLFAFPTLSLRDIWHVGTSGVLIPFFPGIGIGIMYTIKELELELPELDPLLESVPLLESAPLLESVPLLESIPRRLWVLGIPKRSKFCPK